MKANGKYTAIEILTAAGFDKPEESIGKVRVRIGGIPGIVRPDYVVRIPEGTTEIDVMVGQETKKVTFEADHETPAISESAKASLEVEGKAESEKAEAMKAEKAAAKEAKAEAKAEEKPGK